MTVPNQIQPEGRTLVTRPVEVSKLINVLAARK